MITGTTTTTTKSPHLHHPFPLLDSLAADSSSSSSSCGLTTTTATCGTGGSVGANTVLKKGPWTASEDAILIDYVKKHGEGNWNAVQKNSGLYRCGKSCRLRWANHLRPNLKKGAFSPEEERLILELHAKLGNKWARMAAQLPGRTDNEIKNYWNTRIKRRQRAGLPLYPADIQRHLSTQPSLTSPSATTNTTIAASPPMASIFNCLNQQPPLPFFNPQRLPPPGGLAYVPSALIPPCRFKSFRSEGLELGLPFSVKALQPLPMATPTQGAPPFRDVDGPGVLGLDTLPRGVTVPYDPDPVAVKLPFTFDVKTELPSSQLAEAAAPTCVDYLVFGSGGIDSPLKPRPTAVPLPAAFDGTNSGLLDAMLQEAQLVSGNEIQKSPEFSTGKVCDWTNGKDVADSGTDGLWEDSSSIGDAKIKKETMTDECQSTDEEFLTLLDFIPSATAPPSMPEWCSRYGEGPREMSSGQSALTVSPAIALVDDLGIDMQQLTATDQLWGLSSCAWNNMPGIC